MNNELAWETMIYRVNIQKHKESQRKQNDEQEK